MQREKVCKASSQRSRRISATPVVNQMPACRGLISSANLKATTASANFSRLKYSLPNERCARAKRFFERTQAVSKCFGSRSKSPRQHQSRGVGPVSRRPWTISMASTLRSATMRQSMASGHMRSFLNCSWAVLTMPIRIIRVPISRCRWKRAGKPALCASSSRCPAEGRSSLNWSTRDCSWKAARSRVLLRWCSARQRYQRPQLKLSQFAVSKGPSAASASRSVRSRARTRCARAFTSCSSNSSFGLPLTHKK
mmetsp:Transcript_53647/g.154007  ORF Transcript_53647/g.154007 Transcript_53647/m.154007 type:complete len:253 (+) Transcript_53647:832-1590(+)